MNMKLLFIRLFSLLSLSWLITEAVIALKTEELARKSQILHEFRSLYSSFQTISDRSSMNFSIQSTVDYKIFIHQSIEQVSRNIEQHFHTFLKVISERHYGQELENMLKFMNILTRAVLAMSSLIIQQPNGEHFMRMDNLIRFSTTIHRKLTAYRTELDDSFLNWIGRSTIGHPYIFCESEKSNEMILFHIVRDLMTMEMITLAAIKYYHSQDENLFDDNTSFFENNYSAMVNRSQSYMNTVSNSVKNMSSIIYSCDITNYVHDGNFIELEGLVHPVFVSVHGLGSCGAANMRSNIHGCREFNSIKFFGATLVPNYIRRVSCDGQNVDVFLSLRNDKPCYGYLSDCAHQKSREVCRDSKDTRYSWYKIDNILFGKEDSCDNGIREKFENPAMHAGYIDHCHCTCHENELEASTTHILSLAWTLSDVEQNKVVIGIKFTRIRDIIYLQIKQGTLIEDGRIFLGSEEWKSVVNIKDTVMNKEKRNTYQNISFAVLDENTIFDLDDVFAASEWVVTGIRFRPLANQRVKILLRHTKFDRKTGVLNNDMTHRATNPNPNRYEVPMSLRNPILHKPSIPNVPDSVPNVHYVKLKESSRKTDGGGTVLPFFDAQKVETTPSSPLSGIGLYHRGSFESAGFISLKLIALNYNDFMMN